MAGRAFCFGARKVGHQMNLKKLHWISILLLASCATTQTPQEYNIQAANSYFDSVELCGVFGCTIYCKNRDGQRAAIDFQTNGRPQDNQVLVQTFEVMHRSCYLYSNATRDVYEP